MRATWLPDVLRSVGLTVYETPGWRGRGRDLASIDGVMMHHTASSPRSTLQTNLNVVTNGTGTTPGPIAQVLIWVNGDCHIIGDGAANHAGSGGPWSDWLPVSPPGRLSIGNARLIGFECVNDGVGQPWPTEQVLAMELAAAATLGRIGRGADRCIMHSEWAPTRKIDPAGPNTRIAQIPGNRYGTWSGDSFRARVAGWLNPAPPPVVDPPITHPSEETDMSAATLWRDARYHNVFLIGAGAAINVSPKVRTSLLARGVPEEVEEHDQMLASCMHQSGLTFANMVPAG